MGDWHIEVVGGIINIALYHGDMFVAEKGLGVTDYVVKGA
jgi:hypothetical protein